MTATPLTTDPVRRLIAAARTDRTVADLPDRFDDETATERVLRARRLAFDTAGR